MARKRKRSDDIYNARRRYRRAAERYAKKAKKAAGVTRARYEALVRENVRKAEATYSKRPAKSQISENLRSMVGEAPSLNLQQRASAIEQSAQALASQQTAQRMAYDLLRVENVASRFFGGLVEVWRDSSDRMGAIYEFFGTNDIAEILRQVEDIAPTIYDTADDEGRSYEVAKLKLQSFVSRRMYEQAA